MTSARDRLLDAAEAHFYREGINATGIDRLIEAAGVAKMSLYNNFDSKDDLIVAYLRRRHERWQERIEARLASLEDAEDRLLAPFAEYLDYVRREGMRGCRMVNAAGELASDHPGREVVREHKRAVRDLLTELARESGSPDADLLATHLSLLLEGGIVLSGVDGDLAPLERARKIAADVIARSDRG